MLVYRGRPDTLDNPRANNHTDSDLEIWVAKRRDNAGSARDHHQTTYARDLSLV